MAFSPCPECVFDGLGDNAWAGLPCAQPNLRKAKGSQITAVEEMCLFDLACHRHVWGVIA